MWWHSLKPQTLQKVILGWPRGTALSFSPNRWLGFSSLAEGQQIHWAARLYKVRFISPKSTFPPIRQLVSPPELHSICENHSIGIDKEGKDHESRPKRVSDPSQAKQPYWVSA
ncbi:hypothetical protein TNCV_601191 [Trichonephila clavipes]|nr:hypothetical protein TNCV_601191 [Trichonephila clavipes]